MGGNLWPVDVKIRDQDGVISHQQALDAGLSAGQIQRMLNCRRWLPGLLGVYRSAQHELTYAAWLRAVMLWAGNQSHLSGAAAAYWWDLHQRQQRPVEICIEESRRLRVPDTFVGQIKVRRSFVDPADSSGLRGISVVGLERAALMGAVALGAGGSTMLDRTIQRRVTVAALEECLARLHGYIGAPRARRLLLAAGDGAAVESERLMMRLLRRADITGWTVNRGLKVGGRLRIPDFRFDKFRLIVEIDGWAHHHDVDRFNDDRSRQNDLLLAGWMVLRFTWHQLFNEPDWVIGQILAAMRRQAA